MYASKNKYGNKKIVNALGEFDSTLEYYRYIYLLGLRDAGIITDLHRQFKIPLLPNQYEYHTEHLKTKDKTISDLIERKVEYVADFIYRRDNKQVIEDVKGSEWIETDVFKLKKKLIYYFYKIKIQVITSATHDEQNPINNAATESKEED